MDSPLLPPNIKHIVSIDCLLVVLDAVCCIDRRHNTSVNDIFCCTIAEATRCRSAVAADAHFWFEGTKQPLQVFGNFCHFESINNWIKERVIQYDLQIHDKINAF